MKDIPVTFAKCYAQQEAVGEGRLSYPTAHQVSNKELLNLHLRRAELHAGRVQ